MFSLYPENATSEWQSVINFLCLCKSVRFEWKIILNNTYTAYVTVPLRAPTHIAVQSASHSCSQLQSIATLLCLDRLPKKSDFSSLSIWCFPANQYFFSASSSLVSGELKGKMEQRNTRQQFLQRPSCSGHFKYIWIEKGRKINSVLLEERQK